MKNKTLLLDKLDIINKISERMARLGNIAETTTHQYFYDKCFRCSSSLDALRQNGETDSEIDNFFGI